MYRPQKLIQVYSVNVYIHYLGGAEIGVDFESVDVNGILATVQIEVTDNESHTRIDVLMGEITKIMKSIGFRGTMMPYKDDTKSVYRQICRFRRAICNDIETL